MILPGVILAILFSFSSTYHDIHVSITEIEFKETKVEVTVKTFLDDLQIALGLTPGAELPEDYTSSDELIEEYLASTLSINLDEDKIDYDITDISAANDAVWISMELKKISSIPTRLNLESSFLTEVYDDQTNIVNIKIKGTKESFILNKKRKLISYDLKL